MVASSQTRIDCIRYKTSRPPHLYVYYAKWIPDFSDKITALTNANVFPLSPTPLAAFNTLMKELERTSLNSIDESLLFVVECDASEVAVSATLNQDGRPVAFMSRTLENSELHYPPVEKEVTAIIEAVRKWSHFLARRQFTLITDQRSVAFMLDSRKRTQIKNNKIQGWRLELASFSYTITYRPGKDNVGPDTLNWTFCASATSSPNILSKSMISCVTLALLDYYILSGLRTYHIQRTM